MIGLKELRTLLKEPPAEDDAYIKALERAAVAHAERVTGKYLGATATHTDYLVGKGGQVLYLSGPIASGDGLAVTEAPYPGATGEDITEDVVVRGLKLFRTDGTQFAPGYEYAVTYSRGYAADAEPADIRHAVRQMVTLWYEHRLPVSEVQMSPVPASVDAILLAHRAPKV